MSSFIKDVNRQDPTPVHCAETPNVLVPCEQCADASSLHSTGSQTFIVQTYHRLLLYMCCKCWSTPCLIGVHAEHVLSKPMLFFFAIACPRCLTHDSGSSCGVNKQQETTHLHFMNYVCRVHCNTNKVCAFLPWDEPLNYYIYMKYPIRGPSPTERSTARFFRTIWGPLFYHTVVHCNGPVLYRACKCYVTAPQPA